MSVERKYLAHFIDAAFDVTYADTNYVRLGKYLEEFSLEMNPDVATTKNILGEQNVTHSGYESSSNAGSHYYDYDDDLSEKLMDIAMERNTGDTCKTSVVDVLLKPSTTAGAAPTVLWAWREDAMIVPDSVGGDTTGIQIPFTVHRAGNRVKGTFNMSTKEFTPASGT